MPLSMPVVWSERHRLHEPGGEVWIGIRTPGTEVPERADRIREALVAEGAPVVEAVAHGNEATRLHHPDLLDYLAGAWDGWERAGLTAEQDRVVPYIFPHPGLTAAPRHAAAATARAGHFAFDTMTLIGPGTWEAARAAVDVAVTAADLVLRGAPAAYALCRPPGHHVTSTCFGGSCYLNNAAAAALRLRDGHERIALLDVDAHHGNGAQSIFGEDASVRTASVHVDPGAGWFPHFLGFADETCGGANRNVTLAPGTGDAEWVAAVDGIVRWALEGGATAFVVALGVDAAKADPESPLDVTAAGFRAGGRAIGAAGVPLVVVQEGGYDLETIGGLVVEALTGIEEGMRG
jgi:acetoin utilization deacetylase AcuC-like enzyme